MASDLAARPMPHRPERHLRLIFCQAKTILNCPPIQACLDDLIGRPLGYIGNKDILPKPVNISANPVMIFSEIHPEPLIIEIKFHLVQVRRDVLLRADIFV